MEDPTRNVYATAAARLMRGGWRAALGLLLLLPACEEPKPPPPNVLLIVLDTTRADHMSYAGWSRETTPHIDVLAEESIDYRQARSAAPWTLPAHMSIFTGQLPSQHGATWAAFSEPGWTSLTDILHGSFTPVEPDRMLTLRLHERGYTTVGFSNNPWISNRTGFQRGFDFLYPAWRVIPDFEADRVDLAEAFEVPLEEFERGSAGRTLVLFERHLRDHGLEEPFFLFFNFMDAHYPYLLSDRHAFVFAGDPETQHRLHDPEQRIDGLKLQTGAVSPDFDELARFYDAALRYQDSIVGRVLETLKAKGLLDHTMVVVTADHGEHLGERGRFSHQLSVEEELLRVPLLIRYADGRGAGTRDQNPFVSTLDLYATILTAAGAAPQVGGPARDLGRMDHFDRRWNLAEYYYSEPYLRVLAEVNPAFDPEPHRAVHRVVYRGTGPGRFVYRDGVRVAAHSTVNAEDAAWADALVKGLAPASTLTRRAAEPDPELLEALRALGYVGGSE